MSKTIRLRPHHFDTSDTTSFGLVVSWCKKLCRNKDFSHHSGRPVPNQPAAFGVFDTCIVHGEIEYVIPVTSFDDICRKCREECCKEYEPAGCGETDETPPDRTAFFRSLRLEYFHSYPAGLVLKAMQDSMKLSPWLVYGGYGLDLNTDRI